MNLSSREMPDPLLAEIVAQLQAQLAEREQQIAARDQQLTRKDQALALAEIKIRVLEERLRLERIARYGKRSETLSDLQLQLLDLEPGVSQEEVEAESGREPLQPQTPQDKLEGKKRLPADGFPEFSAPDCRISAG